MQTSALKVCMEVDPNYIFHSHHIYILEMRLRGLTATCYSDNVRHTSQNVFVGAIWFALPSSSTRQFD